MTSELADDLGFLLARAHRTMRHWLMNQLSPLNITYQQFVVLTHLWNESGISQSELAGQISMDKTSLARMLGRMEAAELIRRDEDETDSRVNRVNLTAKGRELQSMVTLIRQQGLHQATQGLSAKEVKDLKWMLNHILWNMSSEDR